MKSVLKSVFCLLFCMSINFSNSACADSEFEKWKEEFYQEAVKKGISSDVLDKYLPKMVLLERVIQLDMKKPEYLSDFYSFTQTRLTKQKIDQGQKMLNKYPTWLSKVEKKYGVQKEYLLALWGMETNYGGFKGSVNMLNSLGSLAYHPRRRTFFTNELLAYFKILEKEFSVAPDIGSWDGGFGHFQFMPTTFQAYAVDGDNNGRRDIVRNMPDAFSSAANYLSQMGWNGTEPWGREVILPDNFNWDVIQKNEIKPVSYWKKQGIRPKYLSDFPKNEWETVSELRMPMGVLGPVFLTYPNFRLIMRWNKMELYALTAGLLADSIMRRNICSLKPDDYQALRTEDIMCMQGYLKDNKYLEDDPDGRVGPKTRQALRCFQNDNQMIPDGYPNINLLKNMGCYKND